jgi:hypothetical protein
MRIYETFQFFLLFLLLVAVKYKTLSMKKGIDLVFAGIASDHEPVRCWFIHDFYTSLAKSALNSWKRVRIFENNHMLFGGHFFLFSVSDKPF